MGHSIARKRARQIALLRTQFAQAAGLAFADVLPPARIETALRAAGAGWRDCVYTPVLTLWAAVVAERLGLNEDEALSLGKALAGLTAQSKGRRLGIYKPHEAGAEQV